MVSQKSFFKGGVWLYAPKNTVPVVCVWSYVLVERALGHSHTSDPCTKTDGGTTFFYKLRIRRCGWYTYWGVRLGIFISGGHSLPPNGYASLTFTIAEWLSEFDIHYHWMVIRVWHSLPLNGYPTLTSTTTEWLSEFDIHYHWMVIQVGTK